MNKGQSDIPGMVQHSEQIIDYPFYSFIYLFICSCVLRKSEEDFPYTKAASFMVGGNRAETRGKPQTSHKFLEEPPIDCQRGSQPVSNVSFFDFLLPQST